MIKDSDSIGNERLTVKRQREIIIYSRAPDGDNQSLDFRLFYKYPSHNSKIYVQSPLLFKLNDFHDRRLSFLNVSTRNETPDHDCLLFRHFVFHKVFFSQQSLKKTYFNSVFTPDTKISYAVFCLKKKNKATGPRNMFKHYFYCLHWDRLKIEIFGIYSGVPKGYIRHLHRCAKRIHSAWKG